MTKKSPDLGAFFMDVSNSSTVVAELQVCVGSASQAAVFVGGLLAVFVYAGVVLQAC